MYSLVRNIRTLDKFIMSNISLAFFLVGIGIAANAALEWRSANHMIALLNAMEAKVAGIEASHAQHLEQAMHDGAAPVVRQIVGSELEFWSLEQNIYNWYGELAGIRRREERGDSLVQDSVDWGHYSDRLIEACRLARNRGLTVCEGLLEGLLMEF